MPLQARRVFFRNWAFNVWNDVYEPSEDSFLFAENMTIRRGDTVLDMGTGCGILGIAAAEEASRVVAIDVSPYAVRCAKENAELNNVSGKMLFIQGDLFTPVTEEARFDLILFNAPYLPVKPSEDASWLGLAWSGGVSGRQVIDRFISESPKHLEENGRILLLQSTLANAEATATKLREQGLRTNVIGEKALPFFETIVLFEVVRIT